MNLSPAWLQDSHSLEPDHFPTGPPSARAVLRSRGGLRGAGRLLREPRRAADFPSVNQTAL
jgi:hypothetical protein